MGLKVRTFFYFVEAPLVQPIGGHPGAWERPEHLARPNAGHKESPNYVGLAEGDGEHGQLQRTES